jgi:hypothetical protein
MPTMITGLGIPDRRERGDIQGTGACRELTAADRHMWACG